MDEAAAGSSPELQEDDSNAMDTTAEQNTAEDSATAATAVIATAAAVKQEMELTADKYMLPTYGVGYPGPCPSSLVDGSSNKLFRPVQFYSNGESEDEDAEATVTRSGSHVSVDSAYSSQSDAAKIEVKLHKKSLWKGFMNIGNEMIVTKPGR